MDVIVEFQIPPHKYDINLWVQMEFPVCPSIGDKLSFMDVDFYEFKEIIGLTGEEANEWISREEWMVVAREFRTEWCDESDKAKCDIYLAVEVKGASYETEEEWMSRKGYGERSK